MINDDCNGAANILRKALPDAWEGVEVHMVKEMKHLVSKMQVSSGVI